MKNTMLSLANNKIKKMNKNKIKSLFLVNQIFLNLDPLIEVLDYKQIDLKDLIKEIVLKRLYQN